MRLPASPIAHPSDPAEMSGLAEPASDAAETPAAVADALPVRDSRRSLSRPPPLGSKLLGLQCRSR
ncbi:hypothetical protein ACQCRO_26085, partial [Ralstonia pseudosolanacearum]